MDGLLGWGLRVGLFELGLLTVDEFNGVGVDYAVTLTLNFKVVGNQVNGTAGDERVWGLGWRVAEAAGISLRRVAASSIRFSGVRFAVAALSAAHALMGGAALAVIGLLHAVAGVALVGLALAGDVRAHLLLLGVAHVLALAGVVLLGPSAVVGLLVVILVVRMGHSNRCVEWWFW